MATYHGVQVEIKWQRIAAEGPILKEYLGTLNGDTNAQTFYSKNLPITDNVGDATDDETDAPAYTDDGTEGSWSAYETDGSDYVITGATGAVVVQAGENQAPNAGERVSIDYWYAAEVGMGQGATIELSRELTTVYKLGDENPQEIKAGKISISGRIDDLFTNRDLMGKLMGVKDFYGTLADFTFYFYPNGETAGQPRIGVANVQLSGGTIVTDIDSIMANNVTFEGLVVTIDTVPA